MFRGNSAAGNIATDQSRFSSRFILFHSDSFRLTVFECSFETQVKASNVGYIFLVRDLIVADKAWRGERFQCRPSLIGSCRARTRSYIRRRYFSTYL